MKGTASYLMKFLDGSQKRFIIPVYQRNYDWKKENCKQKGELASQKLLIPNMIMFVGIMAVVVVPMVASMLGGFGS